MLTLVSIFPFLMRPVNVRSGGTITRGTLSKALDYIENPDKTDGKMLVSSFGCSYETADIEFGFTLSQAIQKGNNVAFHLIQSFEPGETDAQTAHEIGRQLADAVTGLLPRPLLCV